MIKTPSIRSDYLTNIPILVSMTLAALWVWHYHAIAESTPLFLGIIAGGLVDMDDRLIGRLRNLFFTLIHFSLAATLVQMTYGHPWAFSLLMVVAAFSITMVGAIDIRYRTIAFGTLLVMLYTVLTHIPNVAWYVNPIMLICGTVLYSFCTIIVYLLAPNRPVQDNLAEAYSQIADYIRIKARFFDPDEADFISQQEIDLAMQNTKVINLFNRCRNALFYRLRNQHRHPRILWLLQYYLTLQNIHERISSRHIEYAELAKKLAHSDLIFRIQRLIVLQADACQNISKALEKNQPYVYDAILSRAGQGLQEAFRLYEQNHSCDQNTSYLCQMVNNILAISDQLQRLPPIQSSLTASQTNDMRIAGQDVDRLSDILPAVRSHFTLQSSVMRHAVRLAILTAVSCLMVEIFHLQMGYWILLTGVIVCQPNYIATTTRLKQRIGGTLLGVIVGSIAPYFIDTLSGLLLIVVIGTVLFFAFRIRRYSFSTFFITVQVLAGFAIIGMDTQAAMFSRFMDTIIGCVLAWCAVSYLWPDWHYITLDRIAGKALQQDAYYLQQIACQLGYGQRDDIDYRQARRHAHECATVLSNTVADMSSEPKKYGDRLNNAMNLLQLNYILLSSISTLGAIRAQINNQDSSKNSDKSISLFTSLAEKIALQMNAAAQNNLKQTEWIKLHEQLEQLQPLLTDNQVTQQVIWAQLKRIHNKLADYMTLLKLDNNTAI